MQHLRLALIACGLWLVAVAAAAGLLVGVGPTITALAACGVLFAVAAAFTFGMASLLDRQHGAMLAQIAGAAGLNDIVGERFTIAEIVTRLGQRLERAHHFKAGIAAIQQPVLLVADGGTILAASSGVIRLAPQISEGHTLDSLFGAGYLASGGGSAEESLIQLAGKRFEVRRRAVGTARYLLELIPAGHFIEDDDLDAFATALSAGQTGFRFEADMAETSPALAALNAGLEAIDHSVGDLNRLAAGEPTRALGRNSGLGTQVRALHDLIEALDAARVDETELRQGAEAKLVAIGRLVEGFQAQAERMTALAQSSRKDAGEAGKQFAEGAGNIKQARTIGRQAQNLAGEADLAARRTHAVVGDFDKMTREIDKMVAAIEDVSFRTNLLALNAAVEAARAGDKGAGFAVVADEVRMLAQLTNRSAKDIRAVVSRGRATTDTGVGETQLLQKMIADLEIHLRNLSNETDTIALAMTRGGDTLERLDARMAEFGDAAGRAVGITASRAS
ncbi:methyl-accepting chemotaxis protein [Devosia sp.]|uniref:methyl-accepting chemotaxis protein n=1 Tax=Devosia sp. TaxID=1871048 RepID=UPI00326393AE